MSDNKSSGTGLGFAGALTIAFVVLKLCGVIDWSWWWIVSPIWISMIIIVAIVFALMFGVYFEEKKKWEKGK